MRKMNRSERIRSSACLLAGLCTAYFWAAPIVSQAADFSEENMRAVGSLLLAFIALISGLLLGSWRTGRKLKDANQKTKIIGTLADEYTSVFEVNMKDETLYRFKESGVLKSVDDDKLMDPSYYVRSEAFLQLVVDPSYHEVMRQAIALDNIRKRFETTNSFSTVYLNKFGKYCELKIVRLDEERMIMGIADRDTEIRHDREQTEQLRTALEKAEKANAAKSTFLFNMSHDIRTPMNAVIGFTDLLEKHLDDGERVQDYLKRIKQANALLLDLLNNVLEMARIESGKSKLNEEYGNVYSLTETMKSIFDGQAKAKSQTFTCSVDVQHPDVMADSTKIREIFLNLLSNAVKYTPEGGSIHLAVKELPSDREGYIQIQSTVSDNGIGMSEDFLPKLFGEFERERTTQTINIAGTGLGMPIVKRLVELHNGTIEVHSQLGIGTTFIVTIPHKVTHVHKEVRSQAPLRIDYENFKGKRILMAEDNEINAIIATEILREKGFEIERAENGVMAVDMVERNPAGYYDLILMDIQMPEMNGYQAAQMIRALKESKKSHIPIIAMTANAFEEDRQEAFQAGMNAHVAKPFQLEELFMTINSTLKMKNYYVDVDELESFKKYYLDHGRPCGYFVYNADETELLRYISPITMNIFGCSTRDEFIHYIGSSFSECVHPEDRERIRQEIIRQQAASERDIDRISYRIIRKDGEIRFIKDIGYKVFDGTEMVYYVYIVDVTGLTL